MGDGRKPATSSMRMTQAPFDAGEDPLSLRVVPMPLWNLCARETRANSSGGARASSSDPRGYHGAPAPADVCPHGGLRCGRLTIRAAPRREGRPPTKLETQCLPFNSSSARDDSSARKGEDPALKELPSVATCAPLYTTAESRTRLCGRSCAFRPSCRR